jgi:hypothetical protein
MALAPGAVPFATLPLHKNVLREASIVVPLSGLPLAQVHPARAVDRGARHPHQALGVEGLALRRACVSPP